MWRDQTGSRARGGQLGEGIEYVIVDVEKFSRDSVGLLHEDIETCNASYYEPKLIRAVESGLSPLGWDREDIQRTIAEALVPKLSSFAIPDEN